MKKKKISKRISSAKKEKAKKVVKKKIKKTEDEFPGYPHYPSSNDIMNPKNKIVKEELTETSGKLVNVKSQRAMKEPLDELMERPTIPFEEETIEMVMGTESDVTNEEKHLLESDELSEDMGEDEEPRQRVWEVDMTGQDLDVPGAELDDQAEEAGTEDEENNIYSIGGDRHEGLEEGHDRGK